MAMITGLALEGMSCAGAGSSAALYEPESTLPAIPTITKATRATFFWSACSNQAVMEDLDHWVVTRGDQRGHVEHMSHAAASAKDHAPTSHDAGVAIDWRHADKRADFAARQLAQLWHLGNQCRTRCFAHAFGAVKQVRQIRKLGLDVFGHARRLSIRAASAAAWMARFS
jgi:hypothetical protein